VKLTSYLGVKKNLKRGGGNGITFSMTCDGKGCIFCRNCVDCCPTSAITMKDEKISYNASTKSKEVFGHNFSKNTQIVYESELCNYCGLCVDLCPKDMIEQHGDGGQIVFR
jgi:formate hydrogenlyase subunit 6/NADH:ubiquinone oxidoreductase subunit I